MKKYSLVIILILTLIIVPIKVSATEVSKIDIMQLVNTIGSSEVTSNIISMLKNNTDVFTLYASKTTSGITVTIKSGQITNSFDYIYNESTNTLTYTLNTNDATTLDTMFESFMQYWLYEASTVSKPEIISNNLTDINYLKLKGLSDLPTTCDINDVGVCMTKSSTTRNTQYLLTNLFAEKVNSSLDVHSNITSSIEAKDIAETSLYLYAKSEGYQNEEKFCFIYRSDEENGTYTKINEAAFNCDGSLGVKDENLEPGKTYYYKAQYQGSKLYSNPIKVTTLSAATKDKDYENPETGAFVNVTLLILLTLLSLVAAFMFKKQTKFYRI